VTIDIMEGLGAEISKSAIKKIAYCGVVGDLFHYGHLHSLEFAKSIADYLIVGVMTDKAVEAYRMRPIANLQERKAVIAALKCVDRVMVQDTRDGVEVLKKIHSEFPDAVIVLVHGSDLQDVPGAEYVKSIGSKVVQHPYYERLSTFKIVQQLQEVHFKDITEFAKLIGKNVDVKNKTIISSKANTLKALKPLLRKSKIEKLYAFTVADWQNKKKSVLKHIKGMFRGRILIRSSSVSEDSMSNSMAGYFTSILNVEATDEKTVEAGIKEVISAYKSKNVQSSFNQVLIQDQTKDIVMSGVVLTRSLEQNSPYYVINYDDKTGASDTVTKGVENKMVCISRFSKDVPENMKLVLEAVKEIEALVPGLGIDVEFAMNKDREVIIFQVRPLTTSLKIVPRDDEINKLLKNEKYKINELSRKADHIAGEKTIFSDMADWNPAEIIGDTPNYLDYSLYDYLITGSAWHEARTSQHYYNMNPAKLVVLIGNKPYVDVRNSFNSFVPASVSTQLHYKLVESYLKILEKHPELQDKVEFDVLFTVYDLTFEDRTKELDQFTSGEIAELKSALLNLTNTLVAKSKTKLEQDLDDVKSLGINRVRIMAESNRLDVDLLLKYAMFLLDDCREKGTVQFSRLARLGFVGKIILKSLVKKGVIDQDFYDRFMCSIRTVAGEISEDFERVSAGKISPKDFLKKYYHLRPGSYDITSLRYDANVDLLRVMQLYDKENYITA